ncbi:MAG: hypothetical protein BAJALOKI1v1_420011 [Promethearchaeota archaeon]|nr:MAG: hypothetical protein BAJALOKI1v1_420011 [Candidatus Lokiarchaeota archaeon]
MRDDDNEQKMKELFLSIKKIFLPFFIYSPYINNTNPIRICQ